MRMWSSCYSNGSRMMRIVDARRTEEEEEKGKEREKDCGPTSTTCSTATEKAERLECTHSLTHINRHLDLFFFFILHHPSSSIMPSLWLLLLLTWLGLFALQSLPSSFFEVSSPFVVLLNFSQALAFALAVALPLQSCEHTSSANCKLAVPHWLHHFFIEQEQSTVASVSFHWKAKNIVDFNTHFGGLRQTLGFSRSFGGYYCKALPDDNCYCYWLFPTLRCLSTLSMNIGGGLCGNLPCSSSGIHFYFIPYG